MILSAKTFCGVACKIIDKTKNNFCVNTDTISNDKHFMANYDIEFWLAIKRYIFLLLWQIKVSGRPIELFFIHIEVQAIPSQ